MFPNRCYERQNEIETNLYAPNSTVDVDVNMGMGAPMMPMGMTGSVGAPIIEPVQERIVNRTFCHEVPHVCPIRTRIINHHVFRHTYRPDYSCCEENVCSTVNNGSCCMFR